jgi:hypothetical protein
MDGLEVESEATGLSANHHDFAVRPGGIVVSISYGEECDSVIERSPGGEVSTVVGDVRDLYVPAPGQFGDEPACHANAITFQPEADTYVLSDRNPNLFVRFTRRGELLWQFGGANPIDTAKHIQGEWTVNHGHHLLPGGSFLFFNNGGTPGNNTANVFEFQLDEQNMTATQTWALMGMADSGSLGDVQRLPNGNVLAVYSNAGIFVEVDAEGSLVQTLTSSAGSVGYANHRETLYGPPPR